MFKDYKGANNGQAQMLGGISASGTNLVLKTGQGDLFPNEFPFKLKLEKYDATGRVVKREIVDVTNKVGDTLTIERATEPCPASFNATEQTQTPFAFDGDDYVFNVATNEVFEDIKDEVKRLESDKLDIDGGTRTGLAPNSILWVDDNGDESLLEFDPVADNGKAVLIDETEGLKLESPAVNIGGLDETTELAPTNKFIVETDNGNEYITTPNLLRANKEVFVAGENITVGDALRNGRGVFDNSIIQNIGQTTTAASHRSVGHSNPFRFAGQSFTVGQESIIIEAIILRLMKVGSPTGNLSLKIYSDTAGTLVATDLGGVTEEGLGSADNIEFNFNNVTLETGVYYLSLETDRTTNITNNSTRWLAGTGNHYDGGEAFAINSTGTWTAVPSDDKNFQIIATTSEDTEKVYKTDASNTSKLNFIGFATNTATTGNNVIVDTSGVSATQSGLTIGSDYYLTNTAGVISTTPGTNIVNVGKAISSTGIQINSFDLYNQNKYDTLVFTIGLNTSPTTINYTHSLGKIPNMINFDWSNEQGGTSGTQARGHGAYANNKNNCWYYNNAGVINDNYSLYIISSGGSNRFLRGRVINVTSTNFSIEWSQAGTTGTGTGYIHCSLIA